MFDICDELREEAMLENKYFTFKNKSVFTLYRQTLKINVFKIKKTKTLLY